MTGTLIGLGGKLRAGKDAVGDYLVENKNFVKLGMSDALNTALQRIGPEGPWIQLDFTVQDDSPWTHGRRRGKYSKGEFIRYGALLDAVGYVEAKRHKDVREYLQGLGTEVGREMIHPDVWVRIAKEKIQEHWSNGQSVVITAIRFPNEIAMVREMAGAAVWVERSEALRGVEESQVGGTTLEAGKSLSEAHSAIQGHASENSVSAGDFDWTIHNNGDLETLYSSVDALLKGMKQFAVDQTHNEEMSARIVEQWDQHTRD